MLTRRRPNGQALVEFALVLPIFFLVLFGTIDGGRLVYTYNQLSQAAREGARVAAVEASWMAVSDPSCVSAENQITAANPGAHVCPADETALKADVVSAANRMAVGMTLTVANVYLACDAGSESGDPAPTGAWTEASVSFPSCADNATLGGAPTAPGDLVSVRIVYSFTPITPVAGTIIGSVPLSASTTMVIH